MWVFLFCFVFFTLDDFGFLLHWALPCILVLLVLGSLLLAPQPLGQDVWFLVTIETDYTVFDSFLGFHSWALGPWTYSAYSAAVVWQVDFISPAVTTFSFPWLWCCIYKSLNMSASVMLEFFVLQLNELGNYD